MISLNKFLKAIPVVSVLILAGCGPSISPVTHQGALTPTPLTAQPTSSSQPAASPAASAIPGVNPPAGTTFNQILGISFPDADHGWLLGSACNRAGNCTPALRSSTDGGQTWQAAPAPPTGLAFLGDSLPSHNVRLLRFTTPTNGWAFGPGLWATRDGGRTWTDLNPGQPVMALETAGDSVWVLLGSCQSSAPCDLRLAQLNPAGLTLQPLLVQPTVIGPQAQLVRHGPQDAWVLSWGASGEAPTPLPGGKLTALATTPDGGSSWQALPSPCPENSASAILSALDSQRLWALCGGGPGAGQQLKTFTTSTDGGRNWSAPHTAPSGGYVNDLVARSSQFGLMGLGRNTLFFTHDGGQTWAPAIPLEQANPSDSSGWQIVFSDTRHGWASLQNRVFRTLDGGEHWETSIVH